MRPAKAMEPVLIPEREPSFLRYGTDEESAITFRPSQASPADKLKKRKCFASLDVGPCMCASLGRPPTFVRTVSEDDVTSPDYSKRDNGSRKRRRVQFGAGETVHEFAQLASTSRDPVNKSDLWYSPSELSEMKRSARRQTRNVTLDSSLRKVYMNATKNRLTPHDVVDSALELIGHPLFGELRGLERWGSDRFSASRGAAILRARSEVLLSQCATTSGSRSIGRDAAGLGQKCKSVNEPAQKFAQVIGLVDYILAQE